MPEKFVTEDSCLERNKQVMETLSELKTDIKEIHNKLFLGNGESAIITQVALNTKYRVESEKMRQEITKNVIWNVIKIASTVVISVLAIITSFYFLGVLK